MKSGSLPKGFPVTDEEWERLIAEAPGEDRPPTPEEEAAWANAVVVLQGGAPAIRAALDEKRRSQGEQKSYRKVSTTLRMDADVLSAFKATGKGWQTRVNEVLREWVRSHPAA